MTTHDHKKKDQETMTDHGLGCMRRLDEKFERQLSETAALRQEVQGLRLIILSDMKHPKGDATDLADMRARLDSIERQLNLTYEGSGGEQDLHMHDHGGG